MAPTSTRRSPCSSRCASPCALNSSNNIASHRDGDLQDRNERNALLPEQLGQFLSEMRERFPQHYPLVATLAMTGLRFCHASGLRWEDFDETARILHVRRRQLRGRVGPVTLVKRAPKEYPVSPELMAVLKAHRYAGTGRPRTSGWMFPSRTGGLR